MTNKAIWIEVQDTIEKLLDKDDNITDIIINYQVKKTDRKHYASINLKTE